jgi:hypothetical protein
MRHSIAGCVLFFLCALAHAQGAPPPCSMFPPDEWERLSAPPPESARMLALISEQGQNQAAEMRTQKHAWLHSKSGAYRYCRSTSPTNRCYAGSAYTDFQLRNGHWYVALTGSTANCPVPQKCTQPPIQDNDSRPNAKRATNGFAPEVALKAIAEQLSKEWSPPSTEVYMAISLSRNAHTDILHFCLENTSTHPLELDDSALPWKVPSLFKFTVLNANGTAVFTSSPFIHQMMEAPARRTFSPSDSVEGDVDLPRLSFFDTAANQDVLVMWSGSISLYGEQSKGIKQLPVSGILFVPKH